MGIAVIGNNYLKPVNPDKIFIIMTRILLLTFFLIRYAACQQNLGLNEGVQVASRFTQQASQALTASLRSLDDIARMSINTGVPAAVSLTNSASSLVRSVLPAIQAQAAQVATQRFGNDLDDLVEDAFKTARAASQISFLVTNAVKRVNGMLNNAAAQQVSAAMLAQRQATIAAENALIAYKYVDQLEESIKKRRIPPAPPIFL